MLIHSCGGFFSHDRHENRSFSYSLHFVFGLGHYLLPSCTHDWMRRLVATGSALAFSISCFLMVRERCCSELVSCSAANCSACTAVTCGEAAFPGNDFNVVVICFFKG